MKDKEPLRGAHPENMIRDLTSQELNELVARKLGIELGNLKARNYVSDISAAWEIVEKIGEGQFAIYKDIEGTYTVTDGQSDEYSMILARADTAPKAICLAFLKLK